MREIRFTWNRTDVFLGCVVALYRRPALMVLSAVPGLLVVRDEFWGSLSLLSLSQLALIAFAYVIVPGICVWAVGLVLGSLVMALRPGKLPGLLGEHLMRIGPEGIFEQTAVNSATFTWAGVRSVHRTVFGVLVQLAGAHWLIPRRYFRDATEMQELVAEAEQHMAATRGA